MFLLCPEFFRCWNSGLNDENCKIKIYRKFNRLLRMAVTLLSAVLQPMELHQKVTVRLTL